MVRTLAHAREGNRPGVSLQNLPVALEARGRLLSSVHPRRAPQGPTVEYALRDDPGVVGGYTRALPSLTGPPHPETERLEGFSSVRYWGRRWRTADACSFVESEVLHHVVWDVDLLPGCVRRLLVGDDPLVFGPYDGPVLFYHGACSFLSSPRHAGASIRVTCRPRAPRTNKPAARSRSSVVPARWSRRFGSGRGNPTR